MISSLGWNESQAGETLIVGAGPAGLATAAMLRRQGLPATVLERGEGVGAPWRERYEGLRLNTLRWLSSQPGMKIDRRHGRWVECDDFVRYLERYADHHRIEVETGIAVERVDREGDSWCLTTTRGQRRAPNLVIACGLNNVPRRPRWKGLGSFTGRLVDVSQLRSATELAGQDVLVAGAGNTGTEITQRLAHAGAGRVRLACRRPPNLVPREIMRVPMHPLALIARPLPPVLLDRSTRIVTRMIYGDLSRHGLPAPPEGVHTAALRQRPPVIDTGFVKLVKQGAIEVVAAVESISGARVLLSDGSELEPDTVILAVGYETGLAPLVGHLGVLDDAGKPTVHAPCSPAGWPGLYFIGYWGKLGGLLCDFGGEGRRTAKAIAQRNRAKQHCDQDGFNKFDLST
jgi:putative flavoprotein involved in K+ transport